MNMDLLVRSYAAENEMTLRKTVEFLSKRDSLQTACEIMGIKVFDDDGLKKHITKREAAKIVDQLGYYIAKHGFKVPQRFSPGVQVYLGYVFSLEEIEARKPQKVGEIA